MAEDVDSKNVPSRYLLSPSPSAAKILITSTRRSLSVSFQGESFSLPISKTNDTPVSHRKPTPERRKPTPVVRDQRENSNPAHQHQLWPGASRRGNFDCDSDDRGNKLESMLIDDSSRVSVDGSLGLGLELRDESKAKFTSTSDFTDSDSVSSGTTNECGERRSLASAKFCQETNTRFRRQLQDPGGSPCCSTPSSRISSIFSGDNPLVSSPRGG